MTKESTEEKIVREFGQKFALPDRISALTVDDGKQTPVDIWLRTTLTSYRKEVLEEVLEGMPTKIFIDPILGRRSIYNDGWNECIDKIRHLIKSLKVDIIKR